MHGVRNFTFTAAIILAITGPIGAQPNSPGVMRWTGTGTQIYTCKREGERANWVFQRPDAILADASGNVEASHGAGPSWTSNDGSVVFGTVLVSIPAPDTGAIPWLVLRASKHEKAGQMSGVAFVLRTDTDGGVLPTTGCDPAHEGTEARVAYQAIYTFLPEPSGASR